MPHLTVGGIRLYHEVHGEGPPLLFLSGTGGDLLNKPNIFDSPLIAHFTVAAHDQRGLGRSDKPDVSYTMADYADDAARLLDALGWPSCRVLGVSFGGMVAQELALRHPDRVERMALCCTSSGGAGGASYPLHELTDLPDETRFPLTIELSDRRYDASWQQSHPDEVAAIAALLGRDTAAGEEDPGRAAGARRQLEARREHDTWARLPAIGCPTLVCAGRHDGIAPPENAVALAERIPGARLEWFDGGHAFLIQDRRAFPTLVEFLEG